MIRISWNHRAINEEVYRRMNTDKSLMIEIVHRQLNFLGHVKRKYYLKGLVVAGFVGSKRARSRSGGTIPHKPLQDYEQVAIGDDKNDEEERSLVEMMCTQQSTS